MDPEDEFVVTEARLLRKVGVQAESRFLDVRSVAGQTHVLVSGKGPPVVMVPGFGDPAAMWAPLMAELGGFTLYAVDRPCFGLTGYARHTTESLRSLAVSFLTEVLDALELERPRFVGSSMGSLWSLWLAMDRPGRVAAMTHVGCPAFLLGTSAPLPMRLLAVRPIGELLMRIFEPSPLQVDHFASMVGADLSALPELRDLLVATQRMPGVPAALRELLHASLSLRGARPEVALDAEQLERITQPVQLIWGEDDPFGSPEIGRRAAKILPTAELHVIRHAGHVPWVGHPAAVGEIAAPFLRAGTTASPWTEAEARG